MGPAARRSARLWQFEQVFLGAEGFSAAGIWASEPEVAKFQQTLVAQADQVIVCAHAAKLNRETGVFLSPWSPKFQLVTDADFTLPVADDAAAAVTPFRTMPTLASSRQSTPSHEPDPLR